MQEEQQAAVTTPAAESVTQAGPFEAALAQFETEWAKVTEGAEGTDEAPSGTAAEATPETPAPATPIAPDESSPEYWRKRFEERDTEFKGLQGTVQRLTEAERKRAEAEQAAAEKLFEERLSYMPADQQALVRAQRRAAEVALAGQQALTVANVGAKAQVIGILCQRHGVTPEDLAECRGPEEMERLAKRIERERQATETRMREARQAERAESGADAFGRGSGGNTPAKLPKTFAEAEDALVRALSGGRP